MEVSQRQAYGPATEPDDVIDSGLLEACAGDSLPLPELISTLIVESVGPQRVVERIESRELGDRRLRPLLRYRILIPPRGQYDTADLQGMTCSTRTRWKIYHAAR